MNILFLMKKTKDQISWVSSHDLYWENKMYKRKRSIECLKCYLSNTKKARKSIFGKFDRGKVKNF